MSKQSAASCTTQSYSLSPAVTIQPSQSSTDSLLIVGGFGVLNMLMNMREFKSIEICESQSPSIARMTVLLRVLSSERLELNEKIEMFLELYGNSKVREKTSDFLNTEIIPQLIE